MIRRIDSPEAEIIQKLAHAIWPDTFQSILSNEQIAYMLNWMYSIETLQEQIKTGHEFYVAAIDNEPVGFMGIEKIEQRLKIHKLYVLPKMQGEGLGNMFIDFAKKRAQEMNATALFLNVNRFNKAVDFYKHIGMQIIKEEDIDIGNGYLMEDFVFELTLTNSGNNEI